MKPFARGTGYAKIPIGGAGLKRLIGPGRRELTGEGKPIAGFVYCKGRPSHCPLNSGARLSKNAWIPSLASSEYRHTS